MGEKVRGNLVVIGGREDREGPCLILRRVVEMAGGNAGRVAVISTAARDPATVANTYRETFLRLGAGEVETFPLSGRCEADDPAVARRLRQATAVFFTGGDQLRLTSTLGGTVVDDALHRLYRDGVVLAGTSAGAAAMSDTMIVSGEGENPPKRCTIAMAPGMGFLEEVVVDQHFAERGRIGRLLSAVSQNPHVLGIGIDEDTAIVVDPGGRFFVTGSQTVTVVDGRPITHTNASEQAAEEPLALWNVRLHVLPAGYGFDLDRRNPLSRMPVEEQGE